MNGSIWILSYVLLWAAVGILGCTVVALLRQIGVLHTRIAPMGVNFAGEGPELDQPAPVADGVDYSASPVTLLAFTSPTCEICATLKPSLERIGRTYDDIELRLIDHGDEAALFARFEVRSTPYLVAVDADGIVRSRGVANTLDQAEEMLAEVLAGPPIDVDANIDASTEVSTDSQANAEPADAEPVVQL